MAHIAVISMYFVGMIIGPATKMRSHALILLLLLSLVLWIKNWRDQQWDKSVFLFAAVFSASTLLSHVLNGSSLSNLELYLLPLAFIPMVHAYRYARLDLFDWGVLILAAVAFCLLWNVYAGYVLDLDRTVLDYVVRYIILYDMSAIALCLMGVLYAFEWQSRNGNSGWVYIVLTMSLSAVMVLVLHGSRGAWIAIPLVLLWTAWQYRHQGQRLVLLTGVLSVLFLGWQLMNPQSVMMDRINSAQQDVVIVQDEPASHTSLGARLSMWKLAWSDFLQAPVFGAGLDQTQETRVRAKEQGLLVAEHPHAHNTYLQTLSVHGLVGFAGLMFFFLYPLYLFYRHRNINRNTRFIFISGSAFVVYVMIGGLTDYYLGFASNVTFYCLITTMLLLQLSRECRLGGQGDTVWRVRK